MKRNRLLLSHLFRLRDALDYLDADRNRFNSEDRPPVTALCIGQQGMDIDRLELRHLGRSKQSDERSSN